jgi:hypothetical protein
MGNEEETEGGWEGWKGMVQRRKDDGEEEGLSEWWKGRRGRETYIGWMIFFRRDKPVPV